MTSVPPHWSFCGQSAMPLATTECAQVGWRQRLQPIAACATPVPDTPVRSLMNTNTSKPTPLTAVDVFKRRVVVAIGAEREGDADVAARGKHHQLEAVQRALLLHVAASESTQGNTRPSQSGRASEWKGTLALQFDDAVLRHFVHLVARLRNRTA